jgi:DNA polymerase (family 10)
MCSRALTRALQSAGVISRRGAEVIFAGSLRRKRSSVKDLDALLVDRTDAQWGHLANVDRLELTSFGPQKAAGTFMCKGVSVNVDIRRVATRSLGAALEYFTGPKGHNVGMRMKAKKLGLKLNEYGLFRVRDGARVAGRTEQEIYDVLKHAWKPPELRGR